MELISEYTVNHNETSIDPELEKIFDNLMIEEKLNNINVYNSKLMMNYIVIFFNIYLCIYIINILNLIKLGILDIDNKF